MNAYQDVDAQLFEAFTKSAQYLARLTSQQDVWDHLAKLILTYFPADWVAFGRRDGDAICFHDSTLPHADIARWGLGEEVGSLVAEVLESGFLASRVVVLSAPSMTAFLPIAEQYQTKEIMLIGHKGADPLPKELLNVYLAVAGLAGTACERLHNEQELNRHRAHLEELVKERTAELARSNKDLEQFAYVASHDLQEPLRMVAGFLQLLADRYQGRLDEKADQYIGFAVDGAQRMATLIQDLLAYSRVNTSGKPLRPTCCAEAFELALRNLRVPIEASGATITRDPLPIVHADKTQLAQLFQNLLGNAVKYRSPDRPVQIHVSVREENGQWLFGVRDNGIGFEQQYEERIFLIFQRLHGRGQYPGTGIGLAICKRIVERHGGHIWATGELNRGATFFFTLPRQENS